ncbi:LAME_0C06766g1_1 [Lachancea meyersii CBS 8951]|uniref:Protein HRI1 n=1 Tax=Lachancea meyersii CBS 8951 TaxID=1266667 RepID=A0A1G4J2J8_9SACH|nr:LAME_0C06766g1_1 [Lachancea meyersii CBS 8951]
MVSISKRSTFQVGQELANEKTLTLSSTSNEGYLISLRPLVEPTESEKEFPFEWAFAGPPSSAKIEKKDELTDAIDFEFEYDTNVQLNAENTHRGVIKTVWKKWVSGLVEERGQVFPFGKDKEAVDFFELWQPLDATRSDFVMLDGNSENQETARSVVLSVDNAEFKGLVITVGRWTQGILFKKNEHTFNGLNILRALEQQDGTWKTLLQYGPDFGNFPQTFAAPVASSVDGGALKWKVVESNV